MSNVLKLVHEVVGRHVWWRVNHVQRSEI